MPNYYFFLNAFVILIEVLSSSSKIALQSIQLSSSSSSSSPLFR